MGIALRRTAFSPNIKERRDYPCAVFDRAGRVIAQGDQHAGTPWLHAPCSRRGPPRNRTTAW